MLQNITVKDVQKVILQSRLYEAGRGNGQFATINNFEIENVSTVLFIFLSPPIKELCSKIAPGEVVVSLP